MCYIAYPKNKKKKKNRRLMCYIVAEYPMSKLDMLPHDRKFELLKFRSVPFWIFCLIVYILGMAEPS